MNAMSQAAAAAQTEDDGGYAALRDAVAAKMADADGPGARVRVHVSPGLPPGATGVGRGPDGRYRAILMDARRLSEGLRWCLTMTAFCRDPDGRADMLVCFELALREPHASGPPQEVLPARSYAEAEGLAADAARRLQHALVRDLCDEACGPDPHRRFPEPVDLGPA